MTKTNKKHVKQTFSYYWCRWTPHESRIDFDALEAHIKMLNYPYLIVQEKKTKTGKRCPLHYHMWIRLSTDQKNTLKKLLDPNKTGNKTLSMPMAEDQKPEDIKGLVSYAYKDSSSHVRYDGIPKDVIEEGLAMAESIKNDKKEKLSLYKRLQNIIQPKVKDMKSEYNQEAKKKVNTIIQLIGDFFKEYEGMSTQYLIKGYIETFCYKYVDMYRRGCLLKYRYDMETMVDMGDPSKRMTDINLL